MVQAQDYRVQYDAIVRIFVLPKSNTPHTLIVISLDPPIRKGQTHYPHILIQFPLTRRPQQTCPYRMKSSRPRMKQ